MSDLKDLFIKTKAVESITTIIAVKEIKVLFL